VSILAELNELVATGDHLDDIRHIDGRKLTVAAHYALELPHLRQVDDPFPVGLELQLRVDQKSRVCVRQCFYSVPVRFAGMRVPVILGTETVEVKENRRIVASHPRAVGRGAEMLDIDHYLEVLQHKPGAFAGSTALCQARSSGRFSKSHERFYNLARMRLDDKDGTKAMIEVLLAHRVLAYDAVVAGIDKALSVDSVDPQVVIVEARRTTETQPETAALPEGLARFDRPAPTLDRYDELLEAN